MTSFLDGLEMPKQVARKYLLSGVCYEVEPADVVGSWYWMRDSLGGSRLITVEQYDKFLREYNRVNFGG